MALAAAALQRPRAPQNGEYHRMETDNPAERFKNGMKVQLFGSIAIFQVPKRKKRKSHTLTLSRDDEHSCIIDWRPVEQTWESSRLQYVVLDGVEGMLEDGQKFWKLYEEYSPAEVARRMMEHRPHSPFPALEDNVDASAQGSSSADLGEAHPSKESNQPAQRRARPRQWLEEGSARAGSQASPFGSAASGSAAGADRGSGGP